MQLQMQKQVKTLNRQEECQQEGELPPCPEIQNAIRNLGSCCHREDPPSQGRQTSLTTSERRDLEEFCVLSFPLLHFTLLLSHTAAR